MRHPTRHMKSAFFRQNSQELTVRMASKSPVGLARMVGLQNLHISNRQTGRADCSEVRSRATNSGRQRGWRQASRRSELAKNYSARPQRGGFSTGIRPGKMAAGLLEERIEDEKSSRKRTPSECRAILTQNFLLTPRKAALAVEIAQSERRIAKLAIQDGKPTCSIYIGIPFCPSRCAYCSFVSYTSRKLLSLIPEYLDRICIDLADTIEYIRSRRMHVVSVYIGGGTPTTLNEQQLEKLLKIVSNGINTKKLAEFTLEAGRPDTITAEKLRIARENGVSRVSINPQTLNDTILRSHRPPTYCRRLQQGIRAREGVGNRVHKHGPDRRAARRQFRQFLQID